MKPLKLTCCHPGAVRKKYQVHTFGGDRVVHQKAGTCGIEDNVTSVSLGEASCMLVYVFELGDDLHRGADTEGVTQK